MTNDSLNPTPTLDTDFIKNRIKQLIIMNQKYEIFHFPAMVNWKLYTQLSAALNIPLTETINGIANIRKLSDEDIKQMLSGIVKVFAALNYTDSNGDLLLAVLSKTARNGILIKPDNFDKLYTGNMAELFLALKETMAAHFFYPMAVIQDYGSLSSNEEGEEETATTMK